MATTKEKKNGIELDVTVRKSSKNSGDWEWVRNPTIAQRNRWVLDNRGLARQCAHRWADNSNVPYEDLESVAFTALIGATERFDKSKGFKFSTFAMPIINFRIINHLRDKGHSIKIPRKYYDEVQKAKRTEKALVNKLGRKPTEKEIALVMGISVEELAAARSAMRNCKKTFSESEENLRYKEKEGVRPRAEVDLKADYTGLSVQQRQIIEIYFSDARVGIPQKELLRRVREAIGLVRLSAEI